MSMPKISKKIFLTSAFMACCLPSYAHSLRLHSYDDWSGPYVGGYISYAPNHTLSSLSALFGDKNFLQWGGFGGYSWQGERFVFSLEAEYGQWHNPPFDNVKTQAVQKGALRLRFGLPLARFMPYFFAHIGAQYTNTSDAQNKNYTRLEPAAGLGAGLQVRLIDSIFMRVEYVQNFVVSVGKTETNANLLQEPAAGNNSARIALGINF